MWESGFISIPYDFTLSELRPKLASLLGGGPSGGGAAMDGPEMANGAVNGSGANGRGADSGAVNAGGWGSGAAAAAGATSNGYAPGQGFGSPQRSRRAAGATKALPADGPRGQRGGRPRAGRLVPAPRALLQRAPGAVGLRFV